MLRLVYLRAGPVVLAREPAGGWRELQAEYPDYMTDLGPFTPEGLADFFAASFGPAEGGWPFTAAQVAAFVRSGRASVRSRA
jgi:hypothetical protein